MMFALSSHSLNMKARKRFCCHRLVHMTMCIDDFAELAVTAAGAGRTAFRVGRSFKPDLLLDIVHVEILLFFTTPRRFYSVTTLRQWTKSPSARIRLRALIHEASNLRQTARDVVLGTDSAERLIADRSNDCRWQALIVVGEFIEVDPHSVWKLIEQYGASSDEDMRGGVAFVLLEHLLEHHFAKYFPRVKRLAQANPLFGDAFRKCWQFGQSETPSNAKQFKALKREIRRTIRCT